MKTTHGDSKITSFGKLYKNIRETNNNYILAKNNDHNFEDPFNFQHKFSETFQHRDEIVQRSLRQFNDSNWVFV